MRPRKKSCANACLHRTFFLVCPTEAAYDIFPINIFKLMNKITWTSSSNKCAFMYYILLMKYSKLCQKFTLCKKRPLKSLKLVLPVNYFCNFIALSNESSTKITNNLDFVLHFISYMRVYYDQLHINTNLYN